MIFYFFYKWFFWPGPASTEGDRPPTNPEIRVRFPLPKQMDVSFPPWQLKCRTLIIQNFSGKEIVQRHLLDKKWSSSLFCMKRNLPTNWLYDVSILASGNIIIHTLLRNSTTKKSTLATFFSTSLQD